MSCKGAKCSHGALKTLVGFSEIVTLRAFALEPLLPPRQTYSNQDFIPPAPWLLIEPCSLFSVQDSQQIGPYTLRVLFDCLFYFAYRG
jgi:hypothetical protein